MVVIFWLCSTAFTVMTDSISQYGITWKFDKQYSVGTFANGDYWVAGDMVVITRIILDCNGVKHR